MAIRQQRHHLSDTLSKFKLAGTVGWKAGALHDCHSQWHECAPHSNKPSAIYWNDKKNCKASYSHKHGYNYCKWHTPGLWKNILWFPASHSCRFSHQSWMCQQNWTIHRYHVKRCEASCSRKKIYHHQTPDTHKLTIQLRIQISFCNFWLLN